MTTTAEASPSTLAVPSLTGVQHLGLTVRDIVASEAVRQVFLGERFKLAR